MHHSRTFSGPQDTDAESTLGAERSVVICLGRKLILSTTLPMAFPKRSPAT